VVAILSLIQILFVALIGGVDSLERGEDLAQIAITMSFCLFLTASMAFVIYAASMMRKLRSRTLGFAAAIVMLVPCFTFYCFAPSIGIGIWAIVVLTRPEVKAAFAAELRA